MKTPNFTAGELAQRVKGQLHGEATLRIDGIKPLHMAGPSELSFFAPTSKKQTAELHAAAKQSKAGLIIVAKHDAEIPGAQLVVAHPLLAVSMIGGLFHHVPKPDLGVHPLACVHPSAVLGEGVAIGPFAVVGENASVGSRTVIHPQVVIYTGAKIGEDCVIHAGAVIREGVTLGNDCLVQPGVVVGSDGFGYLPEPGVGHRRIPHLGNVVLEDGVDLGANTTVDRGTLGETRVAKGAKVDNLVMIGHNVRVGHRSLLCAQVGISGSSTIGDDCILAGQVGVADHTTVGNRVRAMAQSGIKGVVEPNTDIGGSPSMDMKLYRRVIALTLRLPELFQRMRHESRGRAEEKE